MENAQAKKHRCDVKVRAVTKSRKRVSAASFGGGEDGPPAGERGRGEM